MAIRSGVTSATPGNLILDAGAIYIDYDLPGERLLGATRGGSTFNPGRTLRQIEVDGAIGPVKGMRRRESVAPTLQVNLLELTKENLLLAIAGGNVDDASDPTHSIITGGEVDLDDYLNNVAYVGTVSGKNEPIIIILKNVLIAEAPELASAHMDETVAQLTFVAHFDPANLDDEPWEIRYPKS